MGIVAEAHNMKIVGKGEEVIVLSHGFGTDQSVWKHLVPHLVEDYKVVLFDNMGAGTTNPDYFDSLRYSTIDGFASDLIAVLEEVGVKEPCVFVGHSFACMVGALASVACPHLFSKLILLSATPRLLNGEDYFGGFNQEDLDQIYEGMRSNYESWCSGFAPLIVGADLNTIAAQEFCRTLFNMRPDITLSLAPVIFQSDMRHILPLVTIPCHILQSKKDMAVPLMVTEYLHRNISGRSIVEIMPVGGHLPQLSSPDVVIPVILKHIRGDIN